jgi:hypothetical protein
VVNNYALTDRDKAIVKLLWGYMKRDHEHKDRVKTGYGTKTQYGLACCLDAIYSEHNPDGSLKDVK